MPAAKGRSSGRRRLLLLFVAAFSATACVSFSLVGASAATLQLTTTTLAITEAATGQPVGGTIRPTELVTLTATVTGTSSAPAGTVGFENTTAGTAICDTNACSWTLQPTGATTSQASVTLYLAPGTYSVSAGFRPTTGSGFVPSSSAGTTVGVAAVAPLTTTTVLSVEPGTIVPGQSATLTARVTSAAGPTPQGDVYFYSTFQNLRTFIASAPLDANGQASITRSDWVLGTIQLEADYLGQTFVDENGDTEQWLSSSDSTESITVDRVGSAADSVDDLPDTGGYALRPVTLSARLLDGGGNPLAGRLVTLSADDATGTSCSATTGADGVATCAASFPSAGTHTVTASFAGDSTYAASSDASQKVEIAALPTALSYVGPSSVPSGGRTTLAARLVDTLANAPVSGAQVTLALNGNAGETCTGTTDATGTASCSVTVSEQSGGPYAVAISFAGSDAYLSANAIAQLAVTDVAATSLTYIGDTTAASGGQVTVAFALTDASGDPLAGRQVALGLAGSSATVATDADGVASSTFTAPSAPGPYTPTASYGGEPGYLAASGSGSLQVTTIPTTLTDVGDTSAVGGRAATVAFLLTDSHGNPLAGEPVVLTLPDGSTVAATTNGQGIASAAAKAPAPRQPTAYPVGASFAGRLPYAASDGTGSLQVTTIPTALTYVGDAQVVQGTRATLAATLLADGTPLGGETVTLSLASGEHCSSTTDANGVASCLTTTPVQAPAGPNTVTVAFAGDPPYLASTGSGTLAVIAPTTTAATPVAAALQGSTVQLSGTLLTGPGTPLADRLLTLTIGSQSCSATTSAAGVATCGVPLAAASLGPLATGASFAGSTYYLPSSGAGSTIVYAFAPDGGSFVVGDLSATGAVTFWGSQWWKANALSGGADPPSFKGFALDAPTLACGGTWSTDPGNSSPPPAGPLPSYMGVIVSSSDVQHGSQISGSVAGVVVVRTSPGYDGNPGHAGTGAVVVPAFCP